LKKAIETNSNLLKYASRTISLCTLVACLVCVRTDAQPTTQQTQIPTVALDETGQRIAFYLPGGTLEILDVSTGSVVRQFPKSPPFVLHMDFSKDGRKLATSATSTDLWDTIEGTPTGQLGDVAIISASAFSEDAKLLATGDAGGTVQIWDLTSRQLPTKISAHPQNINSIAFSANNRYFAVASADKTISLWDLKTFGKVATLRGHTGSVNSVEFDANSARLVSSGDDGLINVWEIPSGQCLTSIANTMSGTSIAMMVHQAIFSIDGKYVFGVSIGSVGMWDAKTGNKVRSFDQLSAQASMVAAKADGKSIAVIGNDKSIAIIDTSSPNNRRQLQMNP
jgi:WD40 repeat protein